MNKIIKSIVTVFALLVAVTAYGEDDSTTYSKSLSGYASNSNYDYLVVNVSIEQLYPTSNTLYTSGYINEQFFNCTGGDPFIIGDTLKVTPNAFKGSFQVNTSQLDCFGTPPIQITLNCISTNQRYYKGTINGISVFYGETDRWHATQNESYDADCTGTADEVNLDISNGGGIKHTFSVITPK